MNTLLPRRPLGEGVCRECGRTIALYTRADAGDVRCGRCLQEADRFDPQAENLERFAAHCRRMETDPDVAQVAAIVNEQTRQALRIGVLKMSQGQPFYAMLTGPTGCGKTHALLSVGMALIKHGLFPSEIVIGTEHDLVPAGEGDYGSRPIRRWLPERTKVLLLDEFGRAQYSARAEGSGREPQKRLLDHLRAHQISAVFASNLDMYSKHESGDRESLEKIMDPAAFGRLTTMVDHVEYCPGQIDAAGNVIDRRRIA